MRQVGWIWNRHTVVSGWWKQIVLHLQMIVGGSVLIVRCNRRSILVVWLNWRGVLAVWGISSSDITVAETQDTRIETDIVIKQLLLVAESEGWSAFEMMRRWWVWTFEMGLPMFEMR